MRISYAQRRTCSSRLEHVVRSPAGKAGGPREGGEVGPGGPWLMREKRTSMSHRRWLAGLVALGLLATTACGSRLSDEERAAAVSAGADGSGGRSEEHTSELQSLMRISYYVFCFKKK